MNPFGRLVAVLVVTQTMGYGALIMGFPVLLVPMRDTLETTTAAITFASTICTLVGALVAVPIGRWLDRHGARGAMVGGSVLGVVAVLAWSQVQDVAQLYAVFVLIGTALALSTYEVAFAVIVVVTSGDEQRNKALLWLTIATAGASAFIYPVTGWLEAQVGWRGALVVLAALLAVTAVPGHLWVVPGRETYLASARHHRGASAGAALRDPAFWLIAVAFMVEAGAGAAISIQLVRVLVDAGHPAQVAATLPMIIGLLSIPIRLGMGALIRRIGAMAVTGAAFAVQALGALLLYLAAPSLTMAVLAVAACGFGVAVGTLTRPSIFAERYGPARYAGIVSVTALLSGLARAFAPFGAALLPGATFLLWAAAACMLGVAALAAVGLVRAPVAQATLGLEHS